MTDSWRPDDEIVPLPVGWTEVEINAKILVHLPPQWEVPTKDTFTHPFAKWLSDLAYRIFDGRGPFYQRWIGNSGYNLCGEVVDVEMDAGDWGFDAINEVCDSRLGVQIVLVSKETDELVGVVSEGKL